MNMYRYSSGEVITKVDYYGLKTLDKFVLLGEKTQSAIQYSSGSFIHPNNDGNNVSTTISLNEHLDAHGLHDGTHGVNDSKIGETYMSVPIFYCHPKCKNGHNMWGQMVRKYSAEFTIGGILVSLIRPTTPTSSQGVWEHWLQTWKNGQNNSNNNEWFNDPWPTGYSYTVNNFVTFVKNHEKHHYATHEKAIGYIREYVKKYDQRLHSNMEDAQADCNNALLVIEDIVLKSNAHTSKYDTDETMRRASYGATITNPFSYALPNP
jgi:hypothetical protein